MCCFHNQLWSTPSSMDAASPTIGFHLILCLSSNSRNQSLPGLKSLCRCPNPKSRVFWKTIAARALCSSVDEPLQECLVHIAIHCVPDLVSIGTSCILIEDATYFICILHDSRQRRLRERILLCDVHFLYVASLFVKNIALYFTFCFLGDVHGLDVDVSSLDSRWAIKLFA